jgi:hypothetical protein
MTKNLFFSTYARLNQSRYRSSSTSVNTLISRPSLKPLKKFRSLFEIAFCHYSTSTPKDEQNKTNPPDQNAEEKTYFDILNEKLKPFSFEKILEELSQPGTNNSRANNNKFFCFLLFSARLPPFAKDCTFVLILKHCFQQYRVPMKYCPKNTNNHSLGGKP